jgi:hypothetical protein
MLAAGAATAQAVANPGPADAADRVRAVWSFEIGAVGSTPFVEDGNGVTVRAGIGPFGAASVVVPVGSRASVTAGVAGAFGALMVRSAGRRWHAGRTLRADLRAGVRTAAPRALTIGASVIVSRATGPDDVTPFRDGGGIWLWGGEVAVARPVAHRGRLQLLVAGDLSRLAGQGRENPPLDGGWIGRLHLGLRRELR